jgi:hypothetical protein
MTNTAKSARLEPECRTCEDWGTVVVFDDENNPIREIPCPSHVGSVLVPLGVAEAVSP